MSSACSSIEISIKTFFPFPPLSSVAASILSDDFDDYDSEPDNVPASAAAAADDNDDNEHEDGGASSKGAKKKGPSSR